MKIEHAFNTEIGQILTADEAHELFFAGKIADQRNFNCTDDSCDAQITCVNMYKVRTEMKVVPHFRDDGNHSKTCSVQSEIMKSQSSNSTKTDEWNVYQDSVVRLSSQRPPSHLVKVVAEEIHKTKTEAIKKFRQEIQRSKRIPNYFSISPLVARFLSMDDKEKETVSIEFGRSRTTFAQFFQSVEKLEADEKIYYGKAWLKKHEKGIMVTFLGDSSFIGRSGRLSFFISNQVLSKAFTANHWNAKLNAIFNQQKPVATVYLLSAPTIHVSEGDKEYLNFRCLNMDFLEIY